MATIRVRDWTKERLDEISAAEGHSSHDSVVKSLLKDRQIAEFAGQPAVEPPRDQPEARNPPEKAFDDLTVLEELAVADNGLVFLWCPNCGTEIAHIELENPVSMSVFEVECQRCLTRLDERALVAIEINYPIEQRIVEEKLQSDLRECVVDYWSRRAADLAEELPSGDVDGEQFVWQFTRYLAEFGWEWPTDRPVVGFRPGGVYRNEETGEVIEVLESVAGDHGAVGEYRVRKYPDRDAVATESPTPVTIDTATVVDFVADQTLYRVPDANE